MCAPQGTAKKEVIAERKLYRIVQGSFLTSFPLMQKANLATHFSAKYTYFVIIVYFIKTRMLIVLSWMALALSFGNLTGKVIF